MPEAYPARTQRLNPEKHLPGRLTTINLPGRIMPERATKTEGIITMAYQMTSLQRQLHDPSLSLCEAGRNCPLYDGTAKRHSVGSHKASASTEVATLTSKELVQHVATAPYRTVRMGTVSIREIKVADTVTGYSVRAPMTAVRLPSGKYQTGTRETFIYVSPADIVRVVNAQCHGRIAVASRTREALTGRTHRRAIGH